ncbi:unnamed protein product, partial [Mycena citricolor]
HYSDGRSCQRGCRFVTRIQAQIGVDEELDRGDQQRSLCLREFPVFVLPGHERFCDHLLVLGREWGLAALPEHRETGFKLVWKRGLVERPEEVGADDVELSIGQLRSRNLQQIRDRDCAVQGSCDDRGEDKRVSWPAESTPLGLYKPFDVPLLPLPSICAL